MAKVNFGPDEAVRRLQEANKQRMREIEQDRIRREQIEAQRRAEQLRRYHGR